jgi:trans-2,3-dihydro-3-hydroxyanthranilate isomerase
MTSYRYYTADVFTARRFGGNQLAVLPNADGLSDTDMLAVAREFNYSETTFVLPAGDPRHTRQVRIFTPSGEIPFAGHPTVGTAFVLASIGEIRLTGDETRVVFEEGVGPVPVLIRSRNGRPVFSRLTAAKPPEVGPPLPSRSELARILSLDESDLLDGGAPGRFSPQVVSCGLAFAFIPLRTRDAVRRSRVRLEPWEASLAGTPGANVMVFAMDPEEPGHDVRARMFGPGVSVPEDPATGSACAALGGYLAERAEASDGILRWVVEQGYEMGRPSLLEIEVEKRNGSIAAIHVGGSSVMACEGRIEV